MTFSRSGLPDIGSFKKYYSIPNIYQELIDAEDTEMNMTDSIPFLGFYT